MKAMKIVKTLYNMFGYGFAYLKCNEETGMYQGVCSNGNSTKSTASMSECLRDLLNLGYK